MLLSLLFRKGSMNKTKKNGFLLFFAKLGKDIKRNKLRYILVLPILVYVILFCYKPMYGILLAFKDYRPRKGIMGSEWVGLKWVITFLKDPYFFRVLRNTVIIGVYQVVFSFPAPILFALLLNEVRVKWFKKTVQTISYMPHFISLVVICGMVSSFCQSNGVINDVIEFFGGERHNLLMKRAFFRPVYIISGIWAEIGWGAIIYLAALAGIDQEQYEAARIDGANRVQQMIHITLPGILPTVSTLLILKMGSILGVGYEKILLLSNDAILEVADVISTHVYRRGLIEAQFSYSTAVGLFNNLINVFFLVVTNKLSKKLGQSGLF